VPQPHAYRCLSGNRLFDPCFASPAKLRPRSVICYADPWSTGRRIRLTEPLGAAQPMAHPRPWAIRLANGARCLAVTGTVSLDRGVPLTYQCAGGNGAGLTSEQGRLLVALYGRPPHGALDRVAVTTAWTG
jgi:hypothetical protein